MMISIVFVFCHPRCSSFGIKKGHFLSLSEKVIAIFKFEQYALVLSKVFLFEGIAPIIIVIKDTAPGVSIQHFI
jgi:hypothetical protein